MLTHEDVDRLAELIEKDNQAEDNLRDWLYHNVDDILATCREALRKESKHE